MLRGGTALITSSTRGSVSSSMYVSWTCREKSRSWARTESTSCWFVDLATTNTCSVDGWSSSASFSVST